MSKENVKAKLGTPQVVPEKYVSDLRFSILGGVDPEVLKRMLPLNVPKITGAEAARLSETFSVVAGVPPLDVAERVSKMVEDLNELRLAPVTALVESYALQMDTIRQSMAAWTRSGVLPGLANGLLNTVQPAPSNAPRVAAVVETVASLPVPDEINEAVERAVEELRKRGARVTAFDFAMAAALLFAVIASLTPDPQDNAIAQLVNLVMFMLGLARRFSGE